MDVSELWAMVWKLGLCNTLDLKEKLFQYYLDVHFLKSNASLLDVLQQQLHKPRKDAISIRHSYTSIPKYSKYLYPSEYGLGYPQIKKYK